LPQDRTVPVLVRTPYCSISTRVTRLFVSNELSVFFCFRPKITCYEALLAPASLSLGPLALCRIPHPDRCPDLLGFGRHIRSRPADHSGWLLLRMCAVKDFGWLCQTLRVAQVRRTLVGCQLREATYEYSDREIGCGPPRTTSRTRGAGRHSVICLRWLLLGFPLISR
jgi:hypothetical protein